MSEDERRVAEHIFNGYTGSIPRRIRVPWLPVDPYKWGICHSLSERKTFKEQDFTYSVYWYFRPVEGGLASNRVAQSRLSLRELCFMMIISTTFNASDQCEQSG